MPLRATGRRKQSAAMERINVNAAGIDIGAASHFVAVPEDRDAQPVREFAAYTSDLYQLADWLTTCGVKTVAMESTGVYWIPLFQVLEERGCEVRLVDARRVRNVSGRKTDVSDCQWLQQLHTYGLLTSAFRPDDETCVLRAYNAEIEQFLAQHGPKDHGHAPPPPDRASRSSKNGLGFDAHGHLFRLAGVDLTEIPGLSTASVLTLLAETG